MVAGSIQAEFGKRKCAGRRGAQLASSGAAQHIWHLRHPWQGLAGLKALERPGQQPLSSHAQRPQLGALQSSAERPLARAAQGFCRQPPPRPSAAQRCRALPPPSAAEALPLRSLKGPPSAACHLSHWPCCEMPVRSCNNCLGFSINGGKGGSAGGRVPSISKSWLKTAATLCEPSDRSPRRPASG